MPIATTYGMQLVHRLVEPAHWLTHRGNRPTADRVAEFEADLAAMPSYITDIGAWQLSRVIDGEGSAQWTHVGEQDYATLEGLTGAYLMHPNHWSAVERWFDPDYPEWLVDPQLCHTFCRMSGSWRSG